MPARFMRLVKIHLQRKEREQRKKDEREKPLLFKRHKAVRFLISPKIKKVKIEVNKIMNPASFSHELILDPLLHFQELFLLSHL